MYFKKKDMKKQENYQNLYIPNRANSINQLINECKSTTLSSWLLSIRFN